MIKDVEAGGKTYTLAPIRTGQMRKMTEDREKNPSMSYMVDNVACVCFCLANAGKTPLTITEIDELEYPVYKLLLTAAQEVSGFSEAAPGEVGAAV